jgi:predicted TIM-barrel fold metal-dependent hydrolase
MDREVNPGGQRRPRFDVHVHLAGVGTGDSGCWISPAFRRRPTFLGLRFLYRIGSRQLRESVDQDWAEMVSGLVAASDLDFGVALGFDGVYDEAGELDRQRSQLVVPQEWVFEVCRRYPNLLPGPSINPYRRDALERLDDAIERKAALIKWLPIVQGFDPGSPRTRPFLRRVADSGIPLLVHAGCGEVTFATVAPPRYGHVDSLVPALEMGVKVICAHTAAPILFARSQVPRLRALLQRFDNLWVDNSGLANPSRARHLPRFADDPLIQARTLHGSDFPIISSARHYARRLGGAKVARIHREKNAIQRDVLLKRAIGFDEDSFTRAGEVLGRTDAG